MIEAPPVELLHQPCGFPQVVRGRQRVLDGVDVMTDVDGDDVRAFLREPHRVAAALAAAGPGDEGDLALDASHLCTFLTADSRRKSLVRV